ncbi:MAG: GNAT family N-acetyltransferase [Candidatus Freyarchaeota archaeon]|nr:GNAT family N-acetyltransferase [Candidatus Jordarchaeia archaeon]
MCNVECSVEEPVFEYRIYDDYGVGVVAYARVLRGEGWAEIKVINVNRDYRGRGIGSLLLARIVDDHSGFTIVVETFKHLVNWYRRFNFEVICENPMVMMRHPQNPSFQPLQ